MNHQVERMSKSPQSGFTLIEMMIVLVIIAIFAAVAIPSYRQYTVRNAESQTLAKMKQTELELNAWRASSLTYKGFMPKKVDNAGNVTYDSSTPTTIYVPDNANSTTAKYKIILTQDSAGANTLAPDSSVTAASIVYNTWYMYAAPTSSSGLSSYGAKKMILNSSGMGCKSAAGSFSSISTCNTSDVVSLDK